MFEVPEAKRVRREDLFNSASSDGGGGSSSEDEDAQAALRAQLSGLFDLSFTKHQIDDNKNVGNKNGGIRGEDLQKQQRPGEAEEEDETTFTFRLFRDEEPARTAAILTREADLLTGDGGFVVPKRPTDYYIAPRPSRVQAARYRAAAVSAEFLRADAAAGRRWGLEKPWRVIHISSSGNAENSPPGRRRIEVGSEVRRSHSDSNKRDGDEEKKKKTRPGKKHRIQQRVRDKAKREREERAKQKAVEKESHMQEKKKRLNRERKLKRRQKEREKKASLAGGGGADADGSGDDGGSIAD